MQSVSGCKLSENKLSNAVGFPPLSSTISRASVEIGRADDAGFNIPVVFVMWMHSVEMPRHLPVFFNTGKVK